MCNKFCSRRTSVSAMQVPGAAWVWRSRCLAEALCCLQNSCGASFVLFWRACCPGSIQGIHTSLTHFSLPGFLLAGHKLNLREREAMGLRQWLESNRVHLLKYCHLEYNSEVILQTLGNIALFTPL